MNAIFVHDASKAPQPHHIRTVWAALPGISIKTGLRMCNCNRSLYREMLQKFQTTKRNDQHEIRSLLLAGERDTAAGMAHSMKSVAGILGAAELSTAAGRLNEAIAKNMHEQLEARMDDYSRALTQVVNGLDSAFGSDLPIPEGCGQKEVPAAAGDKNHLRGSETILLAEDDQMVMDSTADLLESSGYSVIKACDGAEAVQLFEKHQEEIDLILMDALMPKMTGKQAWNKISSIRPNVKCCFVSGYATDIIGGKLAIDYSLPFISKPVEPATFLKTIRRILDGSA